MSSSRPHSLQVLTGLTFPSWPRPPSESPSPTFTDATHVSALHFGPNGPDKIITRANLKTSVHAYENLLSTCSEYRVALLEMAKATAAFADALGQCSSLKGPSYDAGGRLQAASGLHHLIGNHWHVLADTMDKKFERPLRHHLDTYRTTVNDRSTAYESSLREKSQIIRNTEMRSMNRRERNLQSFREALNILQRQVDELDDLKLSHYREIADHEERAWEFVQSKTCILVRSTMDLFDKVTAKASDPIIELMLQSVPDPFDAYGPPPGDDQIFSILAPLSIMSASPSLPTSSHTEFTRESPSPEKVASWLPNATSESTLSSESTEWARMDALTLPSSTPPRSVSPPTIPRSQPLSPSLGTGSRISSGLRNVLTVIDEAAAQGEADDALHTPGSATPPPNELPLSDDVMVQSAMGQEQHRFDWALPYGHSPYENTTSRGSIFFPQPPDRSPVPPKISDEQASVAIVPVAS